MNRSPRFKTMTAVLLIASLLAFNSGTVYAVTFSDISAHWAQASITRLASLQIVNGYNGKYNPNAGVTRAEFAAMTVKVLGFAGQADVVKGSPTGYRDVPAAHWASGFIMIARELGVISGYPDGTFKPSAMIRRDEITSVLVRALKLKTGDDMTDTAGSFSDSQDIPDWAREAVKIAYNYQLINGFPDGRFSPSRNATRAETAILIEKVLEQTGAEFTFYGKVIDVDMATRQITLDIQGQTETFIYNHSVTVMNEGKQVPVNWLTVGGAVLVMLDGDGYITLIQTTTTTDHTQALPAQGLYAKALDYAGPELSELNGNQPVSALIVAKPGQVTEVSRLIKLEQGKVNFVNSDIDFLSATIPRSLFEKFKSSLLVDEITLDCRVKVNRLSNRTALEQEGSPESDQSPAPAEYSNDSNPGSSLIVTKEAIKAPEFVGLTHSDGKNQIIAMIDTGIDAGHPDLQKTSDGKRKIVEWRDFTDEGDVDTSSVTTPTGKNVYLADGSYYLGDIKSASGKLKYGYFREVDIVNAEDDGLDLNFNGNSSDIFGVLLVDSSTKGSYDTVYVDINGNRDFSDEKPIHLFARTGEYSRFTGNDGKDEMTFVVTEIATDGSKVNFGFDGNDHGTHVAGIAAANGAIKGVAPGAQVMALKVLDSGGYGDLSTITEAMTYAASHGAKIVNMSLGFPSNDINGGSLPAKLLNNLTEKYGVLFVVAAGNDGPGLNTVATPGDATGALSVGAFATPEMWKTDYGWDVPADNLWFFSSVGPRRDGALSPSIVAPGSVSSTVPMRNGDRYVLSEGTSMAAPHVSGAMALLMEVVQRNKLQVSPVTMKKAIEAGANTIQGYSSAEQGFGILNLPMSWAQLLSLQESASIAVQTRNPGISEAQGIYFRDYSPRKIILNLKNNSTRLSSLALTGGSWVSPEQATVNIPPGKTRAVSIDVSVPDRKGLSTTFITGDDPLTYGQELSVLATVINPYELNRDNGFRAKIDDEESPAQYKRYFFRVPPDADSIQVELSVPGGKGRSRVFLFNPSGQLVRETNFAGVNPDGTTGTVNAISSFPKPGVWEAVVYSSAGLSVYNLAKSTYSLETSVRVASDRELPQKERDIIVGIVPKILHQGKVNYVTLQVRDRYSKRPFEGFLEINGEIYFITGGRVTIPVEAQGTAVNLRVETVPDSPMYKPLEFQFTVSSD